MATIDEYLATVSATQKPHLEHIRRLVTKLVPEAEETISYAMPTFKYKGRPLIHFAAFKNHMSIYPTSGPIDGPLSDELAKFKVAKGTLQFTEDNPIPDALIEHVVMIRKKTIDS